MATGYPRDEAGNEVMFNFEAKMLRQFDVLTQEYKHNFIIINYGNKVYEFTEGTEQDIFKAGIEQIKKILP